MPTLDPEKYPPRPADPNGPVPVGSAPDPDIYLDRHCEFCTATVWRIAGFGPRGGFTTRQGAEQYLAEWKAGQLATCDICGQDRTPDDMDWNGDTGAHLSCEKGLELVAGIEP